MWFGADEEKLSSTNARVSSYPPEFLEYMYDPRNEHKTEFSKIVERSISPIRWRWAEMRDRYSSGFDQAFAKAMNGVIGVENALIIPVPTPGKRGSTGVSFYSGGSEEYFEELLAAHGAAFTLAANAAHLGMQKYRKDLPDAIALSKREREVLLWLSQGLRVTEISNRLNLREVTVHMHITNARKKTLSDHTRPSRRKSDYHGINLSLNRFAEASLVKLR